MTPAGTYYQPAFGTSIQHAAPGTFQADTQVPFVGLYTAFTKGEFFLDGQVRAGLLHEQLSDRNNGLFGQQLDARGLSLTGNIGYNIPPRFTAGSSSRRAGLVWSRVEVDPLNVAGCCRSAMPADPCARAR